MSTTMRRLSWSRRQWLTAAVIAALLVAMVMSTKFLTPAEAEAINPPPFSAQTYAAEEFPKVSAKIKEMATDLTVVVPALVADKAAAGEKYGQNLGSGSYAFPVTVTGTVSQVDADFAVLTVPGMPAQTSVRIPLGAAVSGTPVRDATGTITYGDFTDQTDFQSVANQFKLKIQSDVLAKVQPPTLQGKKITVVGAYSTIGAPNTYIIQPVSIEVVP